MNEDNTLPNKTGPSTAVIVLAVAVVAIGVLVYKTKPAAEIAQLPEPTTTGMAKTAQGAEPVTTGMVSGSKASVAAPAGEGNTSGVARSAAAPESRSSGGLAQQPGSFNEPKLYQPNNPYPDYRRTVTASDAGIGASNGATGPSTTK